MGQSDMGQSEMGTLDTWIGREERRSDTLTASLAARWLATFDRDPPGDGTIPQGIHWCLCPPDAATRSLGEDGHPRRDDTPGSFLPPVPLPRRMWASSTIEFLQPLTTGTTVDRVSRVASITQKHGGSGALAFVMLDHTIHVGSDAAVRETQTLVYRDAATPEATPTPPEPGNDIFDSAAWDACRIITPSPSLLFRYSALTFNSHRIHYDAPYARDVERYRGLVVHGPLMASLLLNLAASELGDDALATFTFRAMSPAIVGEPLNLAIRRTDGDIELGTFAEDGRQIVLAKATLSENR